MLLESSNISFYFGTVSAGEKLSRKPRATCTQRELVPGVSSLFAAWPILQIEKMYTAEKSLPRHAAKAQGT
jgi:hypothetical protein